MNKIYDEAEIITLVSQGDERAFANLFQHYKNKIYSIAFKLTHSATIAEEITVEVFLKIWLKRVDLLAIQNFSAYLFAITRNSVYKALKQIVKNYQTALLNESIQSIAPDNTDDYVMDKEYTSLLQEAITRLPTQQKQVYTLIKERGLKQKEAAAFLHLKPDTVKFHLAEAMKNIRSFCTLHLDMITIIAFVLFCNQYSFS